jgi:hypothetical protein
MKWCLLLFSLSLALIIASPAQAEPPMSWPIKKPRVQNFQIYMPDIAVQDIGYSDSKCKDIFVRIINKGRPRIASTLRLQYWNMDREKLIYDSPVFVDLVSNSYTDIVIKRDSLSFESLRYGQLLSGHRKVIIDVNNALRESDEGNNTLEKQIYSATECTRIRTEIIKQEILSAIHYALFEPNSPWLWMGMRAKTMGVLSERWLAGDLQGSRQKEAFWVKCDETTMTQNDFSQNRVIMLVGFAPIKPAEFSILRFELIVGQERGGPVIPPMAR